MGLLNHQQLLIIKGVGIPPKNNTNFEAAVINLDLLHQNAQGYSLLDWTPNIPSLKSGGVWADSPINDGRALVAGVNANVTETITVRLTGADCKAWAAQFGILSRMIQDIRLFSDAQYQIEPVYLQWWAAGAPGPQYAIIFNIDLKVTYLDSPTTQAEIILSIEREFGWRGVHPGGSPMEWTAYFNNRQWQVAFGDITGSTSPNQGIAIENLENKSEFSDAAFTTLGANNGMAIPAASIPGDLPALASLYFAGSGSRTFFWVGRKTANPSQTFGGNAIPPNATFNGSDGTLGVNATLANDTGAVKAAGSGTAQRVEISFATATNQLRLTTDSGNALGHMNRFIGQWMVFLRCRLTATNPTDVTMYLRYGKVIASDSDGIKLPSVNPQVIAGAGNTTAWGLTYMGLIRCPIENNNKAMVNTGSGGDSFYGLAGAAVDFKIGLFATRTAGAGLLYISDLILIPIDECAFTLQPADAAADQTLLVDNTGYMTHGAPGLFAGQIASTGKLSEYRGAEITLKPNVPNYLYFLNADNSLQSRATDTYSPVVNIVPRWMGIRDR